VLSAAAIAEAVERVSQETGGKLDVLINNHGAGLKLPGLDVSIEEGKKLFDVNFWAVWATIQAFAPLLVKAKGCIVNTSTITACMPLAFDGTFGSSRTISQSLLC
jgi:1-acylglycerone phosphate reductase